MQIRLVAKDKLRRQAISKKYTISKGIITAKDRRKAIAKKLEQQSKKRKGKEKSKVTVTITVSSSSKVNAKDNNNNN